MGTVHSGQLQDRKNMAKFLILSACLALSTAAPFAPLAAPLANHGLVGHAHLAAAPAVGYAGHGLVGHAGVVGTHVVPGPTAVHEQVHAGPAVAHHRTITGVVGHRQVQVGTQTVQVGHKYAQTGEVAAPRAAYTQVAAPATNHASVRALPAPPLPVPAAPAALPAPADTVTTVAVDAPVRTHTKITPRLHRIEPELQVNKVPYDVPVAVPVPVERIVEHIQHVAKPYEVAVPRAVPVPQPYEVRPVHQVVETPIIHKKTVTVQQPVVHTAVQTHVATHAVAHAHVAAPAIAAAPAVGYAGVGLAHGALAAPVAHGHIAHAGLARFAGINGLPLATAAAH